MEKKKSNRANLENKKGIFLEIGFIISLTLILAAFEWRTSDNYLPVLQFNKTEVIEELLPVNTTQKKSLHHLRFPGRYIRSTRSTIMIRFRMTFQ